MNKNTPTTLYESNEFEWIEKQIEALREGRLNDIDVKNLSDYLTEMNNSTLDEIGSKFAILLQHLLKVLIQPEKHTRSWNSTITREQNELRRKLKRNPGLKQHVPQLYVEAYEDAVRHAIAETGVSADSIPETNPWTVDQALTLVVADPPSHPSKSVRKTKRG